MREHAPHGCGALPSSVNGSDFRPVHPYRLPEDFPWRKAIAQTAIPVVLLSLLPSLNDMAAMDEREDARKGDRQDNRADARDPGQFLEAALGLLFFYRDLNMEPLFMVCPGTGEKDSEEDLQKNLPGDLRRSSGKKAGKGSGKISEKVSKKVPDNDGIWLCHGLLLAGARAVWVEEANIWTTIASLATDILLLHPVHFPHARKLTVLRLLETDGRRMPGDKNDVCKNSCPASAEEPASLVPTLVPMLVPRFGKAFRQRTGFPMRLHRNHVMELAQGATFTDLVAQKKLVPMPTRDQGCASPYAGSVHADGVHGQENWQTKLSPDEALELLHALHCPEKGLAHAKAVGSVAMALAKRYRLTSRDMDWSLALSAGLLHDAAKGISRHDAVAASWFDYLGLSQIARCVRNHRDLVLSDASPVTERELVFLADKYCHGASFVSLEERFGQKMALLRETGREHGKENGRANAKALSGIKKRLSRARALEARVARELWTPPSRIARMALEDAATRNLNGNGVLEKTAPEKTVPGTPLMENTC